MIAREDDIVACERGHPLYRITRDVMEHTIIRADDFERLHPRAQEPEPGIRLRPCPMCRQPWHRLSYLGHPTSGFLFTPVPMVNHIHFEDGWRPRLPESRPTTEIER